MLRNRSRSASFLCYHSVAARGPRYLTISSELFERHLYELNRRGIRFGDLKGLEGIAAGARIDPSAFLTFDDGFRDNYTVALPILRAYKGRAFVFVLPPKLDAGDALDWPEVAEARRRHPETMRSVTWTMLEEMIEGGFEVGSHTLTHRHLVDLGREELREELSESRARIKSRLGRCDVVAYPFGEHSKAVEAAAVECGYRFAFTLPTRTGQGPATPHSIPRINIDYRDRRRRFAAKLNPLGKRVFLSPSIRRIGAYRSRVAQRAGGRSRQYEAPVR